MTRVETANFDPLKKEIFNPLQGKKIMKTPAQEKIRGVLYGEV